MKTRLNPLAIHRMLVALSLPVAAVLLLISLSAVTPAMNAEPLTPTTHYVAPGGDCGGAAPCYATIQAAVDAASDGDTIKVGQGTYTTNTTAIASITKAITLAGGYSTSDWDIAQPELYPTILDAENVSGRRGIYVDGAGSATIVVEGLTVQNGYSVVWGGGVQIQAGTVILRQLVVRNSRSSGDWGTNQGGGIHVQDGDVTVDSSTIQGNSAGPVSGRGGGLYIEDGRLLVKNSVLRQNFAYMGGGVFATILADLDLESNLFENNSAALGGGAYAESGYGIATEKRVVGNIFRGNSANYGGGGAHFFGGALFEDNLFEGNTAGLYTFDGMPVGGLALGGPAELNRNRFFDNIGEYGGAVGLSGSGITLDANQFRGNQASVAGGALYLSQADVTASNDVITR